MPKKCNLLDSAKNILYLPTLINEEKMKKVLLSISALAMFAGGAMAQKGEVNSPKEKVPYFRDQTKQFKNDNLNNLDQDLGWFDNIQDFISKSSVVTSLARTVTIINNDSLFKDIYEDGSIDYNFWFGGGGILDPKDDVLQLGNPPNENQLTKFNSYRLDSIEFNYGYVRNVHEIIDSSSNAIRVSDTLIISYFSGSNIDRRSVIDQQQQVIGVFARPTQWSGSRRLHSNATATETYILDDYTTSALDTTNLFNVNGGFNNSYGIKTAAFKVPVGVEILASPAGTTVNNLVGYTVHFISGIPAVVNNDTAVVLYQRDPELHPFMGRRANLFYLVSRFVNADGILWENKTFHNTSLYYPRWAAYAPSAGNWFGPVPGIAFNRNRFEENAFKISLIGNVGVGMEEPGVSIAGIYPNPAKGKALVRFNAKSTAPTSATVVNLVGQVVKNIDFGVATAGNNEFNLDLTSLKPGVYFVNITNGKVSATERLVVTE